MDRLTQRKVCPRCRRGFIGKGYTAEKCKKCERELLKRHAGSDTAALSEGK